MQATEMRESDHLSPLRWLNFTGLWTLFGQAKMRPGPMIVLEVRSKHALEVTLIENNDVR